VAFADAAGVFEDPRAVTIDDPHPNEERYVTSAWMCSVESSWCAGRPGTEKFV
jgi:uncharacterized DUF497 family protein